MSLSFPERALRRAGPARSAVAAFLPAAAAVAAMLFAGTAGAAQYFYLPEMEASTEYHTNPSLATDGTPHSHSAAFVGDFGVILGARTPTSETQFRPRLILQHYTGLANLRSNEELLDFKTHRSTPKLITDLVVKYSRQDSYSTELLQAQYDPFDPNNPVVTNAGLQNVGNTVQREQVRPLIEYRYNELTGFGFNGLFVGTQYNSTIVGSQQNFDYTYARPYVRHALSATSDFAVGPFFAYYNSTAILGNNSRSDVYGLSGDYNRNLGQTYRLLMTAQVAKTDSTINQPQLTPPSIHDTQTSWTLLANLDHRLEVSNLRLTVGHDISPSTQGVLAQTDQFRVQYNRYFTNKFSGVIAVRLVDERSSGTVGTNTVDNKYGRGTFEVFYDMTRQLYFWGGYTITAQRVTGTPNVSDNTFLVGIGYKGLGPERLLRLE
jgi:hypothetical protein